MFTIEEAIYTAPGKFVIRFKGLLVRGDRAMPLLFDTHALAKAEVDELAKAGDGL